MKFVDLYKVVREAIRVSEPAYSIKNLETLYMPKREGPVTRPGFAIVEYERWLETSDCSILDSIAGTIRERVKLHGEIRTLSAQSRMAGYILSGMPVAIGGILMLVAPSYMGKLFTPGPWLVLPVVAVIGIFIGSVVMRKLVAIEV